MSRREFPKGVKAKAAARCGGHCEVCGARLTTAGYHYDHIVPDGLGGEPTLENCQVLCLVCHKAKTHREDNPRMQKADRQRKSIAWNIRNAPTLRSRGFTKAPPQRRATTPISKPAAWRGNFETSEPK